MNILKSERGVILIIVGIIAVIGITVGAVVLLPDGQDRVAPPVELTRLGDFSIALADIKREEHTTSLYFAITKVRDTDAGSESLKVTLVDPHEREYSGRFDIDLNLEEEYSDFALNTLPRGFTYVEVVKIRIPKIAPIQTIRVGEKEIAFERVKFGQPRFLEDFGRLAVAKGQSVPVGRWLSFAINEIGGANNNVAARVTVENKDFVVHRAGVKIAAQHQDGTISWGEHKSISASGLAKASEFVASPLSIWKGEQIPDPRILLLMYTDTTNERALKAHALAPGELPLVELKWSFETKGPVHSSPTIAADGTIYVGSRHDRPGRVGLGRLYAINPDGSLKWSFETGGDVDSSPAIAADGRIYVGGGRSLYAINRDGSVKWSFRAGRGIIGGRLAIHSSPAIAPDGTIYVGSIVDRLYAINPGGSLKWSFETGGGVDSSPAIAADGTIYVGSHDGKLYALNPDGSLKWSFDTGGRVRSSPVIAADGTIFVGGGNRLYAFREDNGGPADSPWPMFGQNPQRTGRQRER